MAFPFYANIREQFSRRRARNERERSGPELKVLVVGGGPAALAFATSTKAVMGTAISITVWDSRWRRDGDTVSWKGPTEGVNRREQVVTIQSIVAARLPTVVRDAVFPIGGCTRMWPTGGESPAALGYPFNIRIRDIEDRLLALANSMQIQLEPGWVNPEELVFTAEAYDLVVIADGARSRVREAFIDRFGEADPAPYSVNGRHVTDTVLGLRVTTRMPDADQVLLTIAQQRFLANTANGEGCLYMRLTPEEALEVRGRGPNGTTFTDCIQSNPCVMRADEAGGHLCTTHGARFVPAEDPSSFLWPRVREGLELFNVSTLHEITAFRLSMEHRPRFTAELTSTGTARPVMGALIGDAANAIHFWPGRGLNHGFSSAVSLMRTLATWRPGRQLRSADFWRHEAAMHALQHRHKDRAWRNMVMLREDVTTPIAEAIGKAITVPSEPKGQAIAEMRRRLTGLEARLDGRLPGHPNVQGLLRRIEALDAATLSMFLETGTWEMTLSGGPEVDLDAINPMPSVRPSVETAA